MSDFSERRQITDLRLYSLKMIFLRYFDLLPNGVTFKTTLTCIDTVALRSGASKEPGRYCFGLKGTSRDLNAALRCINICSKPALSVENVFNTIKSLNAV